MDKIRLRGKLSGETIDIDLDCEGPRAYISAVRGGVKQVFMKETWEKVDDVRPVISDKLVAAFEEHRCGRHWFDKDIHDVGVGLISDMLIVQGCGYHKSVAEGIFDAMQKVHDASWKAQWERDRKRLRDIADSFLKKAEELFGKPR